MGHLKIIDFPFGTNGKLKVLSVPILWTSKNHFFYFLGGAGGKFPFKANEKLMVKDVPILKL